ncbi:hypothetical protein BY996DRAFT_4580350 [Phakopsora pachyrhizi]|uniref:chitin deacetylase n=1 Tax=Phakopsora pachyrhizi TaxID=170000 RepID=A0AAV0BJZ5_PHAPC|nr:hypothetical protein BY996DRAFT_4580350 [Phakopsora pachyrhizi]CAH7686645.1 expressed protein [Phakopsora pachyrhizi]
MLAVFSIQVVQLSIFAAEGDKQPDFAKLFMRSERDYPPDGTHGPTPRALWVEAYKAHKAAGRIPSIPPAKKSENGLISYGPGIDGKSPEICSWTLDCRSPSDISNAPENMFGVSFDDGPADGTEVLMQFLTSQKQKATHFTIGKEGVSIKKDTNAFMSMVNADHDIGCHTWSHQYLTTMTDEQVLGELGWQLQIVYDLTQEVQLYLRPPFGDCDNRIRAIAKHVFGMEVVMWKSDTKDWCLNPGSESASVCQVADAPKNEDELAKSLIKLAKASKNPGLITLEHETSSKTVNGFIKAYQEFKNNGWDMVSAKNCFSL